LNIRGDHMRVGSGSVGVRRWWLVIAGVVGLLVAGGWCWKLTVSLLEPGQSGAERANVLVSCILSSLPNSDHV